MHIHWVLGVFSLFKNDKMLDRDILCEVDVV